MANLRPQSNFAVVPFTKESAYGSAIANASVDQLFDLAEPTIVDTTQEYTFDNTMIKNNEFNVDTAYNAIISNDATIPLSFWASPEIAGLLFGQALGVIGTSGSGTFTHAITAITGSTSDQLASITAVVGTRGDTSSYYKYKGCVPNEVKLAVDGRGRIGLSATYFSDGSISQQTGFTIPASKATVTPLFGKDVTFGIANAGSSVVSALTLLRGFEFTWNNNLSREDNRGMIAAGVDLTSLRFGDRSCSLMIKIQSNKGDAYHTRYTAKTLSNIEVACVSGSKSITIAIPRCIISGYKDSFDGIRNVAELTITPFTTTTSTHTPCTITVVNAVSAYLA